MNKSLPVLCAALSAGCTQVFANYTAAVFSGVGEAPAPSLVSAIMEQLHVPSMALKELSLAELSDGDHFNADRFDCLILPEAPTLPAVLWEPITAYMHAGGDVVFLGGKPWADATYKLGDHWYPREEAKRKLLDVSFTPLGGDEDVSRYRHVAFTMETESHVKENAGSDGKGLLIVLDARDWYDYFVRDLEPAEVPPGATLLSLMVKGHTDSKQAYLEVTERDGSVWFRKIPVVKEWQQVVSMPSDFQYLKGGEDREGTTLDLGNLASVGVGQDFNNAGLHHGKYWIWIDELALSNTLTPDDFPKGDLGGDFRVLSLYPYAEYDVFEINEVRSVKTFEVSPFQIPLELKTHYSGISAVGLPAPEDGFFIPLLSAYGAYGDALGWAGGAVVNTAGPYADSDWAFFNMEDQAAYTAPAFLSLLSEVLTAFLDESVQSMRPEFVLSETAPRKPREIDFVQRSADGKTLEDENGEDFFLIGTNYIYPMNAQSFGFWSKKEFTEEDLRRIEDDFRKMQAAGINTVRVFNQDPMNEIPEMNAHFKALCRKYGIQMLMQIVTHSYDEHDHEVMARLNRVLDGFAGDPSVFAFDVQNEPQIGEIGGVRIDGKPSALLELGVSEQYRDQIDQSFVGKLVAQHEKGKGGYPKIAPWIEDKAEVADLHGAENLWSRAIDKVYSPKDQTLMQDYPSSLSELDASLGSFVEALDTTFETWYAPQAARIREQAPDQLVTIGYNRGYVALPFNEDLDFLSQHSYFRAKTDEEVMLYTRIQDKLRQVWPDAPVTIGEFGYSAGMRYGEHFISTDSASLAEFLMYLYSYAQGYSGVMKWRLNDDEMPSTFRDYHWQQTFPEARRLYEARFGMYSFDGYQSIPKPIVHCLSFFRDYVDSYATDRGTIEVVSNAAVADINTAYTYTAKNGLFIGNVASEAGPIQFRTPDGEVASVMTMWNDSTMQLMSTRTMEVTLTPGDLQNGFALDEVQIEGISGPSRIEGDTLKIVLVRGQPVRLSVDTR